MTATQQRTALDSKLYMRASGRHAGHACVWSIYREAEDAFTFVVACRDHVIKSRRLARRWQDAKQRIDFYLAPE